jgi:hypothetical protein
LHAESKSGAAIFDQIFENQKLIRHIGGSLRTHRNRMCVFMRDELVYPKIDQLAAFCRETAMTTMTKAASNNRRNLSSFIG